MTDNQRRHPADMTTEESMTTPRPQPFGRGAGIFAVPASADPPPPPPTAATPPPAAADPPEDPAEPTTKTLYPSPAAPLANARLMVADTLTRLGMVITRNWRNTWMEWVGDHWAEREMKALRAIVYDRFGHARFLNAKGEITAWNPNRRSVSDVLDALESVTHLPEGVDTPAWLDRYPAPAGIPATEVVACQNTLVHVTTRQQLAPTPAFFNRVSVPFDYDPAAPEPTEWLAFLRILFPDDPDSLALLAEFFGYVLSGRTDLQKILLVIGPQRSGKGTITKVLQSLVGVGNYAGPSLTSLGTNFGLMGTYDKPLAIIADARAAGKAKAEALERLLNISGEDTITLDRKNREPWTGKLPTRFVILSNELPRFGDASGAIVDRFLFLTLTESFLGREDLTLFGRILPELPGVLNWALDGLDRLNRNGHFTVPASSEDAARTMHDMVSPTSAFIRERCIRGAGQMVVISDLFAAWCAWCKEQGREYVGNVQTFGGDVMAAAPGLIISKPRIGEGGKQVRTYQGLGLLDPADTGPRRLCVLHGCYSVSAPGSQFCAQHPGGETRR